MRIEDKRGAEEQRIQAAKAEMLSVLEKHLGKNNPDFLFEKALGELLTEFNYKNDGILESNSLGWTLDHYVARSVGPHVERIVQLADYLIEKCATPKRPFDFEHADRYAAVLSHDKMQKLLAFQTQSLSYLVRLTATREFSGDEVQPAWDLDLRFCTANKWSLDFKRPEFTELTPKKLEEYFRYQDGRDQGYLLSLKKDHWSSGYEAKDMDSRSIGFLSHILQVLHCHSQMVEEEIERQRHEDQQSQPQAEQTEEPEEPPVMPKDDCQRG